MCFITEISHKKTAVLWLFALGLQLQVSGIIALSKWASWHIYLYVTIPLEQNSAWEIQVFSCVPPVRVARNARN